MIRPHRRRVLLAAGLASLFAAVIVAQTRSGGASLPAELATVAEASMSDTALASGTLVHARQISLRSELTGRVAEVLVDEGARVVRGALLMRLDPEPFAADLRSAEAAVRAAAIEIESRRAQLRDLARRRARQQSLHQRGLVGAEAYELIASQHEIAAIAVRAAEEALGQQQGRLDLARDRMARTEFLAPIDGVVVSVDVEAGETVIAGTVNIIGSELMTIADPAVLLAELRVDEADIARIAPGQPAEVYAAAHPGTALAGRVVHIGSSARTLPGGQGPAFRVRIELDAADLALFPGMSCRAEIRTASTAAGLAIPVAAVRRDHGRPHVWRIDADGRAERVTVDLGLANDLDQIVLAGLAAGDRVVVGPGRTLAQLVPGARLAVARGTQ